MSREGTWRRLAQDGKIVVPVDEPMFARLEIAPQDEAVPEPPTDGFVEIDTDGVTIRLPGTTPAGRIADVVSALSADGDYPVPSGKDCSGDKASGFPQGPRRFSDGVIGLSKGQFEALFEGLDWRRVLARRVRRPGAAE